MNKEKNAQWIANYFTYALSPKMNYITIEELNTIELKDNSLEDFNFFKEKVLEYILLEIKKIKINKWEKIWVLLSWWLDSALLLSILKKNFPDNIFYTYTLAYSSLDSHLISSRTISNFYKTIHKEIIYDLDADLLNIIDEIYSKWFDLEWEDSLIMNYIIAKEINKDGCKNVFSWFGLDYVFAWMDLFRNSFVEKLYNRWLINTKYLLELLWWNKFYLKYLLDKINLTEFWSNFFIKFWEFYWDIINSELLKDSIEFFNTEYSKIRNDLSILKKQIYYIIFTSLSNRFNPYNKPYQLIWATHYNIFWNKDFIKNVISLNIPEDFLYNPFLKEKKYILREIAKNILPENLFSTLNSWTVLRYGDSIKKNKLKIINLVNEHRSFLGNFYNTDFLDNISLVIEDSMWYEESIKIVLLLQFVAFSKYNKN